MDFVDFVDKYSDRSWYWGSECKSPRDNGLLRQGMNVELEHRNVTHANLEMTAKIAFPNYYEELEKMEAKLTRQWRGKWKPDLFL